MAYAGRPSLKERRSRSKVQPYWISYHGLKFFVNDVNFEIECIFCVVNCNSYSYGGNKENKEPYGHQSF